MERLSIGEAFKRRYVATRGANRQQEARTDRATVEQDGTAAAGSHAAAFPHAPQFEVVAENFEQRVGVLDEDCLFSPVDPEGNFALHWD
jgi:hypothetical protein